MSLLKRSSSFQLPPQQGYSGSPTTSNLVNRSSLFNVSNLPNTEPYTQNGITVRQAKNTVPKDQYRNGIIPLSGEGQDLLPPPLSPVISRFNLYWTISGSSTLQQPNDPVQYLDFRIAEGINVPSSSVPVYFETQSTDGYVAVYKEWSNSEVAGLGTGSRWGLFLKNKLLNLPLYYSGAIESWEQIEPLANYAEVFGSIDPLEPTRDGFTDWLYNSYDENNPDFDNFISPGLSQSFTDVGTGSADIYGENHLILDLDPRVTESSPYLTAVQINSQDNYVSTSYQVVSSAPLPGFPDAGRFVDLGGEIQALGIGWDGNNEEAFPQDTGGPGEGKTFEPVIKFNEVGQYLQINPSGKPDKDAYWRFENTNQFTYSGWFFPTTPSNFSGTVYTHPLINIKGTYSFAVYYRYIPTYDMAQLVIYNGKTTSNYINTTFQSIGSGFDYESKWNNFTIAVDKERNYIQIHLNGVDYNKQVNKFFNCFTTRTSGSSSDGAFFNYPTIQIGGYGVQQFSGSMGQIRLYNRSLADNQIKKIYDRDRPRYTPSICFDEEGVAFGGNFRRTLVRLGDYANGYPAWKLVTTNTTFWVYWNGTNWIYKRFLETEGNVTDPNQETGIFYLYSGSDDVAEITGVYTRVQPGSSFDGGSGVLSLDVCPSTGSYFPNGGSVTLK